MAIRYCGDVEIRMRRDSGGVRGTIRTSTFTDGFFIPTDDYDHAASAALRAFLRLYPNALVARLPNGRLDIRSTFQAPCPRRK